MLPLGLPHLCLSMILTYPSLPSPFSRELFVNRQKECDVLWLYGPLYEFSLLQLESEKSAQAWLDAFDNREDRALASEILTNTENVMCPEPTTTTGPLPESNVSPLAQVLAMESISPLATGASELRISTALSHESQDSSLTSSPSSTSSTSSSLFKPQKSALKQQGTRLQLIEELRCFATSPQYLAICNTLTTFRSSTPISSGTRSEPLSPITPNLSTFVVPIFPPSKRQYRHYDRRRASFPKSASHPNRLNSALTANPISNATSTKQLRFSLEVQELVFLPTSPPFRISRAKPTRAHSDPAIQTSASSSFIAPSHAPSSHIRDRNLIATATASGKESTTTFIKIQDRSSSSSSRSRNYGVNEYEEEDELGISFDDNDDDYLFQDCNEDNNDARHQFVPAKDVVVARRVQDEQHPRRIGPGVLWQVYTAVTGVKELIAWYGSMVYHSSSL
ncbi:hypothetical protein MVEG_03976 [Podila verticillata NRRL 6337]|nr:hypothetical protein MVEG_03976 [Podila verticillata NRRL 6337]